MVVERMKNITVISGGTATNHILDGFDSNKFNINYILPVSDNGGSSSEIIRVFGGCAIGDIRSRLVRLIPDEIEYCNKKHINGIKELLSFRLSEDENIAKNEWCLIVDGSHLIWDKVENRLKVMLLSFLIHVDMEIHKRLKLGFKFQLASIGNLFLTGTRLFFGDLDSGIELISRICRISENINVAGCLNTNFTYHIAAILENGGIIRGQSQISHPVVIDNNSDSGNNNNNMIYNNQSVEDLVNYRDLNNEDSEDIEIDKYMIQSQLRFEKDKAPPLESKIIRIMYISPYGEEIHPRASLRTINLFKESDCIVYSVGSLFTSIIPVILLGGIGEEITKLRLNSFKKILLLNGSFDRETNGLCGLDFVKAIMEAVEYSLKRSVSSSNSSSRRPLSVRDVVTDLVYVAGGELSLKPEEVSVLEGAGVRCHRVEGEPGGESSGERGGGQLTPGALRRVMDECLGDASRQHNDK